MEERYVVEVRRAGLKLYYEGSLISEYIEKDLLSFTYTDRASGAADDVNVTLEDSDLKWLKDWFPEKGDWIHPIIEYKNWNRDKELITLDCGEFIIDEPLYSGPPAGLDMAGNSMPSNSGFKDEKKTKSWANNTFEMIARTIASNSGLKLFFDSKYNPTIRDILQDNVSDSEFLMDLSDAYGYGFKISNRTVIIYSIEEYEKKDSVAIIKRHGGDVLNYSLGKTLTNTGFSGVKIRYKDSIRGTLWYSFLYGSEDGKIFRMDEIADDYAMAERMALSKFKELNRNEFKINLTVYGNPNILGATCVTIEDFGKFDGKYFVDQATHSIGSSTTTTFEAHKVVSL